MCFDSLNVMDETAITLCKENNIPVIVFNIMVSGAPVCACAQCSMPWWAVLTMCGVGSMSWWA